MRFFLLFSVFLLLGCKTKQITFDVTYVVAEEHIQVKNNELIILDYPLYFQSNVEKNYSKKGLISSIELVEISFEDSLPVQQIAVLENNFYQPVFQSQNNSTIKLIKNIQAAENDIDFKSIFNSDKISVQAILRTDEILKPNEITLKFRMKGKLEKTNIQYRILA